MKTSRFNRYLPLPALALAICFTAAVPFAHAVERVWDNTGTTWNSTTSWVGDVAPTNSAATDTVLFTNTAAGNNAVGFTSNRSISTVTFNSTANIYTLADNSFTLTIGSGGIVHSATNLQTINTPLIVASSHSWSTVAGGSLTTAGVDLAATVTNRTLTIIGAGNVTIGGEIKNSFAGTTGVLSVTSTGATVLSGNNTYDGLTTMNASGGILTLSGNNSGAAGGVKLTAGTLNVNNANALGSGTLELTAGSILDNTSGLAVVNASNNAITLTTIGSGITFGTAASTLLNDLNLGSATVTASSSRTINFAGTGTTLTMGRLDSTSLTTSRTFTFTGGTGNTMVLAGMKLANAASATVANLEGTANLTITGLIENGAAQANGVNVKGTGITAFNGNNTYDGLTALSSGATLRIGNANALGTSTSGTTVASGAVLDLNGQAVGAEAVSLSGSGISAAGALVNTSGSASISGAITLTGDTTIGAGNITLGNVGQSGTRSLTKTGAGTLTLGGTNSYTGGTVIVDGTVNITGGNNAVGSFKLEGSSTTPVLKLSNLNALATTATLAGASSSVNTGTVDLAVAGSYSLAAYTGNNMKFTASSGSATTLTFTGNSVITSSAAGSGGRTITNTDSNLNLVFSGDLEIGSTATSTVTISGSGNTTVGGSVFNTGAGVRSLEKSGSGTLTLNGANSYNGVTDIKGTGKVLINGDSSASTGNVNVGASAILGGSGLAGGTINVSGVLAPGNSVESLGSGSLNFITGSTYAYEIDATATLGLQGDLAYSSGTLDIATGTNLTLTELASGIWSSGAKLTLISYFSDGGASGWNDGLFNYGSAIADDSSITIGSQLWTFNYNDLTGGTNYVADQTGNRFVTITAIPEPNAAMLAGGLGMLVLLRRRRIG